LSRGLGGELAEINETKSLFEDLEIWKEGRKLRKELLELVKTFPEYEKYRLSDQIIRASRSVTAKPPPTQLLYYPTTIPLNYSTYRFSPRM